MSEHLPTPRLSVHARERCEQMGLSTKVAKRIVQHADMVYPGNRGSGCFVAVSDAYPGYLVVFTPEETPTIVTVSFRLSGEHRTYIKTGSTYVVVEEAS